MKERITHPLFKAFFLLVVVFNTLNLFCPNFGIEDQISKQFYPRKKQRAMSQEDFNQNETFVELITIEEKSAHYLELSNKFNELFMKAKNIEDLFFQYLESKFDLLRCLSLAENDFDGKKIIIDFLQNQFTEFTFFKDFYLNETFSEDNNKFLPIGFLDLTSGDQVFNFEVERSVKKCLFFLAEIKPLLNYFLKLYLEIDRLAKIDADTDSYLLLEDIYAFVIFLLSANKKLDIYFFGNTKSVEFLKTRRSKEYDISNLLIINQAGQNINLISLLEARFHNLISRKKSLFPN